MKRLLYILFCLSSLAGLLRAQSITVTSPNGGETWAGATTQNISWTAVSVTTVNIEFSTNNGSSWNLIVSSHSGLSSPYSWAVPGAGPLGSTQCLVRVSSSTNSLITDQSNATFTIPPSGVTVSSPNGSELFKGGAVYNIRWVAASVTNVDLFYSTNNGTNWVTIATSIPANRGFYNWILPSSVSSTTMRVRVWDSSNNSVADLNDNTFTLVSAVNVDVSKFKGGAFDGYSFDNNRPKTIVVNSPNGGEVWSGATTQNITWTSQNVDNVRIEYSSNAGSSWNVIQATYPAGTGTFPWLVPGAGPLGSTTMLVRISNATDLALNDVSDNHWTIPSANVVVVSPDGSENFFNGTMRPIRWTSQSVVSLRLEYSSNNGSTWNLINDDIAAQTKFFSWVVPTGVNSTQCLIRLRDRLDYSIEDVSNANFRILPNAAQDVGKFKGGSFDGYASDNSAPKTLVLTSPNGAEVWSGATTQNITWTSLNVSNVRIEYSTNNGSSWILIIDPYPAGTGTYSWTVPGAGPLGTTTALVRVLDAADVNLNDQSNAVWTIPPSTITITAPSGGETFFQGTSRPIRWNSLSVLNVRIDYSTDNGSTWILIAEPVPANRTFFSWLIPTGVNTTTGKVRVRDFTDVAVFDVNPGNFSIRPVANTDVSKFKGGSYDGYAFDFGCIQPIAVLTGAQTICPGNSTTLTASIQNTSPWTLTWTDGTSSFSQSGITSSPFVFSVTPAASTSYSLTNLTGGCQGTVSGSSIVTVASPPSVALSGTNTILLGQGTNLSFSFTGTAPWNLSYTNGTSLFSQNGITSNPYVVSVSPTADVTYSPVSVGNPCSGSVSGSAVITVNSIANALLSGSQSLCLGNPAVLTVTITGPSPWNLTWTDGQTPVTVTGITQSPYLITVTPTQSSTYSLVSIVNPLVGNISGSAVLSLSAAPSSVSGLQQAGSPSCSAISWNWSSSPGATNYRADISTDVNFGSFVSGWQDNSIGNTQTISLNALPPGTNYYLRVRAENNCGLSSNISGVSGSTIALPAQVTLGTAGNIVCAGFTANWNASNGANGYELEVSLNNTFTSLVSGYNPLLTGNVLTQNVTGLSENTTYYWRVRGLNTCGNGAYASFATTSTANLASTVTSSGNSPVCTNGTIQLSGASSYSGVSYSWSGPGSYSANTGNASRSNVSLSESGNYSLSVSASGCATVQQIVPVVVNSPAGSLARGGNRSLCSGETLTLTASASGSGVVYSWAGPSGFTATGSSMVINSVNGSNQGVYSLIATSPGCNQLTDTIQVAVTNSISVTVGNNSPVCQGDVVFIQASLVSGSTYTWTGPNGFSSNAQNPSLIQTTPGMSGQYTLTLVQPGCTNPLSYLTQVTVSPNINAVFASSNSPVCNGSNLGLSITVIPGATYTWSGPAGFTSSSAHNTISSSTIAQTGQYSVMVNIPGCTSVSRILNAEVYPTLTAIASSNSPVCESGILLFSSPVYLNATYSWSGPSGFTSNQQSPSVINAGFSQSGQYTLVVSQPVCGVSSTTVSVSVSPSPSNLSSGSNSPVCAGNTLLLTASSVSGMNYLWSGPGGFTSSSSSASRIGVTGADAGQYTLTLSSNGCQTANMNLSVNVSTGISVVAGAVTNPVCEGSSLNLTSNFVPNALYSWTGPNGFSSNRETPAIGQVSSINSGVYTLVMTQPGCGTSSSTVSVVVGTSMNNLTTVHNSPVCTGGTLQMSATSLSGVSYLWTGPGGFTSSSNNVVFNNVTIGAAGNYSLAVSSPGCTGYNFIVKAIINNTGAVSTTSNSPVCAGGVLQFATIGLTGATYSWSGPGGFTSNQASPVITNTQSSQTGIYSLFMTVPNCGVLTLTSSVQIGANLNASNVSSNAPICMGSNLQLSGGTITGASYSWAGPNGFTSGIQFPVINGAGFTEAGVYSMTISTPGCIALTRTLTVQINPVLTSNPGSNGPVCQGGAVYFTSNTVSGATYNWAGPNGFVSTLSRPSILNAQPISSGEYTLTLNAPGCNTALGTTTVQIGTNLTNILLSSNSPVCLGNTLTLTANSIGNGSIGWSAPDGFTSDTQGFNRTNAQLGFAGVYSAVITSPGCGTLNRTLNVAILNPVMVPGSNSPVCQGNVLQLSMNSLSGATYSWSGPLGFVSTQQNPSIGGAAPTRSGIYTLTATTSSCGALTATTSVVVGSTLGSLSVTSNSPICVGGSLNLTATDRTGFAFLWSGPNGFTSALAQPVVTPATALSAGRYTVVIASPGCGSTTLQTASLVVNNPASVSASSNTPVCVGTPIYFNGSAPAGSTYSWSGPVGFVASGQAPSRSNAQLIHTGIYTLNTTVPGCGAASTSTSVVVNTCREGLFENNEDAALVTEFKGFSLEVYPNPTEGVTTVILTGIQEELPQLTVLDLLGHEILIPGKYSATQDTRSWELDFRGIAKGVYFVKLMTAAGEKVERVVVR